MAVWEGWLPREALCRLFEFARDKLAKSNCIWASCVGAGAGFVATANRIDWSVSNAFMLIDDLGNSIHGDFPREGLGRIDYDEESSKRNNG